jgi:hypothetical protein
MISTGEGRDLKVKAVARLLHDAPMPTWDAGVDVRNQPETRINNSFFTRHER